VALSPSKKNKKWILKAVDRLTQKTIAWVIGKRNVHTCKQLYEKLKHLKDAVFYTDYWEAFISVLPSKRHVIGKAHTVEIERNNSNTRHRLARMTRKTKVVSHSEKMIDLSMRLFAFFEYEENRNLWIRKFRPIF